MDFEELLEQKKNPFNHIFYEFEMYHDTYEKLKRVNVLDERSCPDWQFWKNILIESHAIHLRNLIHFFSGRDKINANIVLIDNLIPCISGWNEKTKIINNAISHISDTRFIEATGANNLTTRLSDLIKNEHPQIVHLVSDFLEALGNRSGICNDYLPYFEKVTIQDQYQHIKNIYKMTSIELSFPKPVTTM